MIDVGGGCARGRRLHVEPFFKQNEIAFAMAINIQRAQGLYIQNVYKESTAMVARRK